MKRMAGLLFVFAGGAALVWGVVSGLTGSLSEKVALTNELSVTALTGGLAGAALFTVGLVWSRD